MKLSRILRSGPDGDQSRTVAVVPEDELVIDLCVAERRRLQRKGASTDAAQRVAGALFPGSLTAALRSGEIFTQHSKQAIEERDEAALIPFSEVRWTAAIDPPVMLDASAFEQHLVNAHARGKREVPDLFYEIPVYYKMNPVTVLGHEDTVPWPGGARFMDYELEIAIVIGSPGADLRPEEALTHILGVTVMNDISARDVQAREMTAGFGPAKGKDFATTLGPVLVSPDELGDLRLEMVARVNGEERSRGNLGDLHWSWDELVAHAGRNTRLLPGDVLGSGTVGTGCILEHGDGRWLQPGDVVELEIERIGVLRNTVA